MAGINTGPSFMSRMGKQMPGMVNALGQNYGGNLSGMAKGSSSLLGMQKRPGMPNIPKPMQGPPMQAPGQQVGPPEIPSPMGGLNTGPSPELFSGPFQNLFQQSPGMPSAGASGMRSPRGSFAPPQEMGGLFGTYNRLAQNPNRRY